MDKEKEAISKRERKLALLPEAITNFEEVKNGNDWLNDFGGDFEYFCMPSSSNLCSSGVCSNANLPSAADFVITKNRDEYGQLLQLNWITPYEEEIERFCGAEELTLYSKSYCMVADLCSSELNPFRKMSFSESTVFTDTQESGHTIRINDDSGEFVEILAVGAHGTTLHINYGQCFTKKDLL